MIREPQQNRTGDGQDEESIRIQNPVPVRAYRFDSDRGQSTSNKSRTAQGAAPRRGWKRTWDAGWRTPLPVVYLTINQKYAIVPLTRGQRTIIDVASIPLNAGQRWKAT